jgi:hypothetical protein
LPEQVEPSTISALTISASMTVVVVVVVAGGVVVVDVVVATTGAVVEVSGHVGEGVGQVLHVTGQFLCTLSTSHFPRWPKVM